MSITIKDLFQKFNIRDTRISNEVLEIPIKDCTLKDFTKETIKEDTIILTGEYIDKEIDHKNNKIEISVKVNPFDEWNTVEILRVLKDNFASVTVYNMRGGKHTVS